MMTHPQNHESPGDHQHPQQGSHPAVAALAEHYEAVAKASEQEADGGKHEAGLVPSAEGDTAAAHDSQHVESGDANGHDDAAAATAAKHVATDGAADETHIVQPQEGPEQEYEGGEQPHVADAAGVVEYAPAPAEGAGRARRNGTERYHASMEQLKHLVAAFEDNPCPSVGTLNYLSETIDMPMHNLVLWFKNRRARSKKTHRIPGQRRSYVKSGIYSRTRRNSVGAPQQQHSVPQPVVHHDPPVSQPPPPPPPPPAPQSQPPPQLEEQLPEQHPEQGVDDTPIAMLVPAQSEPAPPRFDGMMQGQLEESKRPAPPISAGMLTQPTKRARVGDVAETTSEVGSACRSWSSLQCLRAFVAFFDRSTGGLNPEQAKAAENVATQFFLGELQSGLTVTSVAQPLHVSFDVLDQLLAKRSAQGAPPLSSGSRAVLGEFIAQIRSGEAAYDPAEQAAVAGDGSGIGSAAEGDGIEKVEGDSLK